MMQAVNGCSDDLPPTQWGLSRILHNKTWNPEKVAATLKESLGPPLPRNSHVVQALMQDQARSLRSKFSLMVWLSISIESH